MKQFSNKNVIITGGSEGIGFAIAMEFAKMHAKVFLIARNPEKLTTAKTQIEQSTQACVEIYSADVTNREAIETIIHTIGKTKGGIDVLICNAGYGGGKRFEDCSIEALEHYMQTNYFGVVYAAHAAWGYLKASKGYLGLVSSVAGYTGLWGYTGYAPTKFAITALAECLRMEANDFGMGVTIIYPPDTDTPLLHRTQQTAPPELLSLMKGASLMNATTIAQKFVRAIQKGKFEVICNAQGRLIRVLRNLLPAVYFYILDDMLAKSRKQMAINNPTRR